MILKVIFFIIIDKNIVFNVLVVMVFFSIVLLVFLSIVIRKEFNKNNEKFSE